MHRVTKIATCCYCGTRATLVLAGHRQHELACAACGAPLHNLKALKVERDPGQIQAPAHASESPKPKRPARKRKKARKRRSVGRKILSEAFDLLEDVFD